MKKLLLAVTSVAFLSLVGCGDGGAPAKQSVDVKPVTTENQTPAPGSKFKNPGSSEKPGAGAGAPPASK